MLNPPRLLSLLTTLIEESNLFFSITDCVCQKVKSCIEGSRREGIPQMRSFIELRLLSHYVGIRIDIAAVPSPAVWLVAP